MTVTQNASCKRNKSRFLFLSVVAVAGVVGIIWSFIWSFGVYDRMPSDEDLQQRFRTHQADFDKLIQMSDADGHVTVIRSNITRLDTDWSWPRQNVGFSDDRWNEYRRMFRQLKIDGLTRAESPARVAVVVYASDGVLVGSEKGLVYSVEPLTPISSSLDQFPRDPYVKNRGYALVYKPLGGNWYIYRGED
jgi:hypothetical protein